MRLREPRLRDETGAEIDMTTGEKRPIAPVGPSHGDGWLNTVTRVFSKYDALQKIWIPVVDAEGNKIPYDEAREFPHRFHTMRAEPLFDDIGVVVTDMTVEIGDPDPPNAKPALLGSMPSPKYITWDGKPIEWDPGTIQPLDAGAALDIEDV